MELVQIDDVGRVVEFSKTDAALADLRKRLSGTLFEVTTTAGMRDAKAARAELRGLRTDLERRRKELKAPLLEAGRIVDTEAKRITGELSALEEPIDAQIVNEEQRKEAERAAKERAERDRVDSIQTRIRWFTEQVAAAARVITARDVEAIIGRVELVDVTDSTFAEFTASADDAKRGALQELRAMELAAANRVAEAERITAERAELDRQRAEHDAAVAAERERMAAQQRAIDEERARLKREERERCEAANRAEAERLAEERRHRDEAEAKAKADAEARAKVETEKAIERATLDEAITEVLAWAAREGFDQELAFRKLAVASTRRVAA